MLANLLKMDQACFMAINQGGRNVVLDWIMPVISGYNGGWVILALTLLFFLIRGSARTRKVLLVLLAVFILTDILSSRILKPVFARPRPYADLAEVHYFNDYWRITTAGGESVYKHTLSFPSSHAVNATAAAAVAVYFAPRLWPFLTPLVILICYSRVYLGRHYPLDVLAGILIGLLASGSILWALNRLSKRFPDRFSWFPESGLARRPEP